MAGDCNHGANCRHSTAAILRLCRTWGPESFFERHSGTARSRAGVSSKITPDLVFSIVSWARRRRGLVLAHRGMHARRVDRRRTPAVVRPRRALAAAARRPGHSGVPQVSGARRQPRSAVRRVHRTRGPLDRRLSTTTSRPGSSACESRRRSTASTPAPPIARVTSSGSPIDVCCCCAAQRWTRGCGVCSPKASRVRLPTAAPC